MDFKKCKIKYWVTPILAGFMCILMAGKAWALPAIRQGNILNVNGTPYYFNVRSSYAYIPISANQLSNVQALAKMTTLPSGQTGFGDWASRAAFRYPGLSAYSTVGSNSQYLVKTTEVQTVANKGWTYEAPGFYNPNTGDMLSFRYSGMVMIDTGDAIAGTNPKFPSDTISTSSTNGGTLHVAEITKKQVNADGGVSYEKTGMNVYGSPGGVHQLANIYTNGMNGTSIKAAVGNVLTNKYTAFNEKYAEKAFLKWVECDDGYGAAYKEQAETWIAQQGSSLKWWEVLNQFFQIKGNPNDPYNTVYFYMVGGVQSGHTFYTTYSTGGKVTKNATPTLLAVKDNQTGEILGEAYRNPDVMSAQDGADPESSDKRVKLEYGKFYTVNGILSYYSSESGASKTNRGVDFGYLTTANTDDFVYLDTGMQAISVLPDANALTHDSTTDGKSYGTINASGKQTNPDENGDTFNYNSAAFTNISFTIAEGMPASGYLALKVPTAFSENSDNDVITDDRIMLPYMIAEPSEDDPCREHPENCIVEPAYGDLNLGMPEYRDLHYIAQHTEIPEEEEGEGGESGSDAESGTTEGEEKEPIITILEKSSGYGYYKDVSSTPIERVQENDTPATPDRINIWDAGSASDVSDSEDEVLSDPWWEYDSSGGIWPNQLEDLENKCWLLDANGGWNQSGEFLRSKSGENSFGFGFRVSRSRGEGTLPGATLETEIYGVSPDTGDDGILLTEYTDGGNRFKTLRTGSIGVYEYADVKYQGIVSSEAINGIEDFPYIRVITRISEDVHGESGFHTSTFKAPAENSWQEEHDTVDRTFACEMDDMRILEVEVKDSEGIVIYNANRYDSSNMDVEVDGYFDREEDLFLKVVIEQSLDSGHQVNEPAIDVTVRGLNEDGSEVSTYINDVTYTKYGEKMYLEVPMSYDDIAFRPRNCQKLRFSISINEKHGEDMWRENIWDNDEDAYTFTIDGTTADLAISQDVELYNSKNNPQEFLTFAEYLSFKFNIKHIGGSERQTAVVGGTDYNPFPKVNVSIYNADALSTDPINGNIIYRMASQDPKAASALIMEGDIQAETRLFPGLGTNDYASHVQAWYKNYIVQSFVSDTGNVAAYGHILVAGNVDSYHDTNGTNIRNNSTDYVQKEFYGEKNFKIVDIGVSSRNSISDDTGIAVQAAIENTASSYNDQTVVDKTYLDIYIDDELIKTIEVEVPVGDTIVTEALIDEIDLEACKIIEVRVNTGRHQTHYEYVLKSTDSSLYPDPFIDNYMSIIVCPNKPNETICPLCVIDDNVGVDSIFGGGGTGEEGETPIVPDHDNVTDTSTYSVLFEMNDGSATNKVQSIAYNSSANLAANTFNYSGYKFVKWNTKADGSGTDYADKAVISTGSKQSYGSNTTLTLYAQWEPITYTISFNANGGTGTMNSINCTFDEAQYLPGNTFEKSGYMFKAWNTQADGGGISIENGGSVMNFTDVQGKDVVLYAQWITEMDCIILENFSASSAVDLKPGDMIAENPSLLSMVDYSSYGYLMVKIPTVSATKDGDVVEKIYDLFSADWNTADWTKVYENVATVEGDQSVYVWRYLDVLAPDGTTVVNPNNSERMANRTTDLYSRLTVGNFTSLGTVHVSTELQGLVYAAPASGTITPEEMAITDKIALAILGIVVEE